MLRILRRLSTARRFFLTIVHLEQQLQSELNLPRRIGGADRFRRPRPSSSVSGIPKLVWFRKLKNSERNCRRMSSRIWKSC